jgi:hypothetical protein
LFSIWVRSSGCIATTQRSQSDKCTEQPEPGTGYEHLGDIDTKHHVVEVIVVSATAISE